MLRPRQSRTRIARVAVLALIAVAAASAAPSSLQASLTAARQVRTYHPRTGLTLSVIRYADGPVEVRALEFAPKPKASGYTVETGISGPVITTHTTPSTLGEELGAAAAMNGDFSLNGQPAHFNAVDGDVRTDGLMNGSGFAISRDERFAYTGHTDPSITAESSSGQTFRIDHWNGDDKDSAGGPVAGEITAYTKDGGTKQNPSEDACAVRLINPGARRWSNENRTSLSRTWNIGQKVCQNAPLVVGSDPGNVVLNSRRSGVGADALTALPKNGTLTVSWRLGGWPGILDVIGAQPAVVKDGVNVGPPQTAGSSYFYKDNPRTGIGITEACSDDDPLTQCRVIYMTVDGRRAGWSVGMTLKELGDEMLRFDAYNAVNIDGGGSTALWLNNKGPWCISDSHGGCLVTKPAYDVERATLTSMLVLQGRDVNEPQIGDPARTTGWNTAFGLPDDVSQDWDRLALMDPGSTGGLLDALDEQGQLPDGLQRYLRIYRGGSST